MSFELHPRLRADTFPICNLPVCQVLLMNDARYPWLILVPQQPGLRDLHEIDHALKAPLFDEITRASVALESSVSPHKLNVAALGNQVEQLHIHIIARQQTDSAWPGPVWGVGEAVRYTNEARDSRLAALCSLLKAG